MAVLRFPRSVPLSLEAAAIILSPPARGTQHKKRSMARRQTPVREAPNTTPSRTSRGRPSHWRTSRRICVVSPSLPPSKARKAELSSVGDKLTSLLLVSPRACHSAATCRTERFELSACQKVPITRPLRWGSGNGHYICKPWVLSFLIC